MGPASPLVWSLRDRDAQCLSQATSVRHFVPVAPGHCHTGRGDRPLDKSWDPLSQPARTSGGGVGVRDMSTPWYTLPSLGSPSLSCPGWGPHVTQVPGALGTRRVELGHAGSVTSRLWIVKRVRKKTAEYSIPNYSFMSITS